MWFLPLGSRHHTLDYRAAALETKFYQNGKLSVAKYLHLVAKFDMGI